MSRFFLGNQAVEVSQSPQLDGYSKVVINIDDETSITVGNDSARTLELDCPWGTLQMAQQILAGLSGYAYKPYEADGTLLDPAAELGDSISVHGVYGGVYTRGILFDDLHSTDISAPVSEEVEHEYEYHPQQEQKIKRQFEEVSSQLTFQSGEIAAKVSKTGGTSSSFGWTLTESGFVLSSGSKEVFRADADGITVTGNIQATSGYIGNANNGFTISNRAIYNGTNSMSSTATGVYIGTDGINLGGGKFKVDSAGNLTASSGTFSGNVYASSILAGTGPNGVNYGTFDGSGISGGSIGSGQLRNKSVTKEKLAGAIKDWLSSEGYDLDTTVNFIQGLGNGNSTINIDGCSAKSLSVSGSAYFTGSAYIYASGGNRSLATMYNNIASLQSQFSSLSNDVATAKSTAASAKSTAESAKTTAQTANYNANTALSRIGSATLKSLDGVITTSGNRNIKYLGTQ